MLPFNVKSSKNNFNIKKEVPQVPYEITSKVLHYMHSEIPIVKKKIPPPATFQAAMKLCILIGQCFGLNPVLGVCETDTSKLRFTIYSGRCLYTFISLLGQLWFVALCFMKLGKDNSSLSSNTSIVFYGTNCMTTILFIRIAMKWPKLCQHIAKMEAVDPNLDTGLVRRCNFSCIFILSLALVEHLLCDLTGIISAIECYPDKFWYDAYITRGYDFMWTFLNYSPALGLLVMTINFQCTFNWNFVDTFVICISWYLASRFKQVNERIAAARGKYVSINFWRRMREDYCKAASLVRKVDNVVSGIIFISFTNNLFFICLQFLHILENGVKPSPACERSIGSRPLGGYEESIYLLFSFGFLMFRALSLSLIAASVHTASKLPAQSIYDVPSACYCIEVQRLIDQLHGETVALSGLQFFKVKRGLVLTIAGTIVTYELVLMQFAGVTPTAAPLLTMIMLPSSNSTTPTI